MIVGGDRVAKFVADQLGFGLCPPYTAMGIERNGKIAAGVVFNCFEGADVHVTVAGKGWSSKFLQAVGEYVYVQLGCERMTVTTEQINVASLALRFGGKIEGCLRNHFGKNRDATIIGILKDEWRYGSVSGE